TGAGPALDRGTGGVRAPPRTQPLADFPVRAVPRRIALGGFAALAGPLRVAAGLRTRWGVRAGVAAASSECSVISDSISCSSALEQTPSSSTSSHPSAAM